LFRRSIEQHLLEHWLSQKTEFGLKSELLSYYWVRRRRLRDKHLLKSQNDKHNKDGAPDGVHSSIDLKALLLPLHLHKEQRFR
jgi:hypothetical protein